MKEYKVTEEQMYLLCSIVNCLIEKSEGYKNGEYDVEHNGMWYDTDGTWGFMAGDDMESDEEEVTESLEWVFNEFIKEK